MNNQDDEIRRLQRLRNEQLSSRDPTAKDRAKMQRISKRHHKSRQPFTIKRILRDLPAKWLLMIIGGVIGIIVALIMNMIVDDPWVRIASYVVIVFGLVAGRIMGAVRDWGDEDWVNRR
ncbi:MAG TPA: hypothetical protein PKH77_19300 [Anaerolineae bacterium]|nr:hypothetical protein [Anaerolineae bacterium]